MRNARAWICAGVFVLTAAGCSQCDVRGTENRVDIEPLQIDDEPLSEVPVPNEIYRNARRKAQKEITADNARERLRVIERQVASETKKIE